VRRAADSCCFRFRVVACKTPSPTGALAWEAGVLLNYEHLLLEQKVKVKSDSSYCFHFNEMARPAGLEPAAF